MIFITVLTRFYFTAIQIRNQKGNVCAYQNGNNVTYKKKILIIFYANIKIIIYTKNY